MEATLPKQHTTDFPGAPVATGVGIQDSNMLLSFDGRKMIPVVTGARFLEWIDRSMKNNDNGAVNEAGAALINASGKTVCSSQGVDKRLASWNPLDPVFIVEHPDGQAHSVLHDDRYYPVVQDGLRKQFKTTLILLVVALVWCASVWWYKRTANSLNVVMLLATITVSVLVNHGCIFMRRGALIEFTTLIVALRSRFVARALPWGVMMALCGLGQILSQSYLGGFDALMWKYGMVHEPIMKGEFWRLLPGSSIHSGFPHWFGNALMLVGVAPVATFFSRRNAVMVFVLGLIVGGLSAVYLNNAGYDSTVGLSSGIFCQMGWLAGIAIHNPRVPRSLFIVAVNLLLLSTLAAYLLNPKACTIAHLLGGVAGVILGYLQRNGVFDCRELSLEALLDKVVRSKNAVHCQA